DGIRDDRVTGVQTCALPISGQGFPLGTTTVTYTATDAVGHITRRGFNVTVVDNTKPVIATANLTVPTDPGQCAALVGSLGTTAKLGRASCRERVQVTGGGGR